MKRSRLAAWLGIGFLAIGASIPAHATLLIDNGAPSTLNPSGSNLSDTQQAQDFLLSTMTSLTSIRFWSLQLTTADYLGSIFWEIRTNASGTPGSTVVASGTAAPTRTNATAVDVQGTSFQQYQNDFNVSVNNLASGFYWLTLHNGGMSSNGFSDFYWAAADLNSSAYLGQEMGLNPQTSWYTNEQELAFQMYGTSASTPEPATYGLVGLALVIAGLTRKRD